MRYITQLAHPRRVLPSCNHPPLPPKKAELKKNVCCMHDDIKVLRDLRFSRNETPKSADE